MLQSFIEKGDFCWHCHAGIYAYPMWIAIRYKVPLIFWGETSAEYTSYYTFEQSEEVDERRFNRFVNLGITSEDMLIRINDSIDERDMLPFKYPPLTELKKINCRSVCLGSYIPWDTKKQYSIINKELGWSGDEVENVPAGYEYEKIECYMQGVRDYIKFIKRGYSRPTHLASLDIRNNRLKRDDALKIIEKIEGRRPPSLDIFLKFVGLTEEEFMKIAKSHTVSPWEFTQVNSKSGKKVKDFERWSRVGAMDKTEAKELLNRFYKRVKEKV